MRFLLALLTAAVLVVAGTEGLSLGVASPAAAAQQPTDPIPASCTPFGPLGSNRPIDQVCGLQGATDGTNGQKALDRVEKNVEPEIGSAEKWDTTGDLHSGCSIWAACNVIPC